MNKDYIPQSDETYSNWFTNLYTWVNNHGSNHGLDTNQVAAITNAWNTWNTKWTNFNVAKAAFHAATQEKDSARMAAEVVIRVTVPVIQANPNTTNGDREEAGITVPKTTHTPSTTPDTTPMLQEVDSSTRSILRIFIADSTTPESRAKPSNARCVEIREQIGGTAPTDPEAMDFLAMESRMPYRADFATGDIGKTVYLVLRWIGKNNQPGPWSQIYSVMVPG